MVKIVIGNLLEAKEDVLCHQVNCMGVMGSGLAWQIRNKCPNVYEEYVELCKSTELKSMLLGTIQKCVNWDIEKIIINMFSQYEYGRNKTQTIYDALDKCLTKVSQYAQENDMTIALPYHLGCGLAGGDWNIVLNMIERIFEYDDVTIYKLPNN